MIKLTLKKSSRKDQQNYLGKINADPDINCETEHLAPIIQKIMSGLNEQ